MTKAIPKAEIRRRTRLYLRLNKNLVHRFHPSHHPTRASSRRCVDPSIHLPDKFRVVLPLLQLQFCWGRLMAVAASPLARWPRRVGAPSPNFSPSFVPHLSVAASFPFTTFERLFPSFVAPLRAAGPLLPACPFVRSIVTVLSSLTACRSVRPSAGPSSVYPMGRWARAASARPCALRCKSPSREGLNIPSLDPRCDGPKGRRRGRQSDGRTGHACMHSYCRR